jgi:two-component system nitrogen regulation response regulator GlnG
LLGVDEVVRPELDSPFLLDVISLAERVAISAGTPVLIQGEPGSPVEEVARLIHDRTPRARDDRWVAVRCQGLPEHAIELELFGGPVGRASASSPAVERARHGTLFIERVTDLGVAAQARLVALLENGARDPGGSARVIAASSTDPASAVRDRSFRGDLLEQLSVVTIKIPPLRSRVPDVDRLSLAFAKANARSLGKHIDGLSPEAIAKLRGYPFPGNERELRNVIGRAVVVEVGTVLGADSIELGAPAPRCDEALVAELVAGVAEMHGRPATLAEIERAYIIWMLKHTNGNRTAASRMLGISYPTIAKKIVDYGIDLRMLVSESRGASK